ncbi:MAG: hypothetical protein EP329_01520 [Deltaproteobacteria bacterium]|nr:MAG: hypothetical protein EP329_01520 [Deltaproteobacteria bacterium]
MKARFALPLLLASSLALLACGDAAATADEDTASAADTASAVDTAEATDATDGEDTAADSVDAGPSAYRLTIRGSGYAGVSYNAPVLKVAVAVWDDASNQRVHWQRLDFTYADDSFEIVVDELLEPGHRYRVATHGLSYPNNSIDEVPAVEGDVEVVIDWRSSEGDYDGFFLTSTPVSVPPGRYDWNPSHDGRLIVGVTDDGFLYQLAASYGCQVAGGGCGSFLMDTQVRCNVSRRLFKWADTESIAMNAKYEEKYQEATLTVEGSALRFAGVMGSDCCEHSFSEVLVRTGDLGIDCP